MREGGREGGRESVELYSTDVKYTQCLYMLISSYASIIRHYYSV